MFDVDWMGLLVRDALREQTPALIAETCAWAVGLSDRPHLRRRAGMPQASGPTLGERAAGGLPLSGDDDGRLELADAVPGSFQDALNALAPDGRVHAERFDEELLVPFVHATCLTAAERARTERPTAWAELADDVGEDGDDLAAVVRAGEWEAPLRIDAEQLVLAALGATPLLEVETEGLPLSLVRAAEAVARDAAVDPRPAPVDDDLAGSLFLARAAVAATGAPLPVPPSAAERLVEELLAHGLEAEAVPGLLPDLPVQPATADEVLAILRATGIG